MPSASSSASLHYPPIPAGTVLKCRFCQIVGGVVSPVLANLFLHYAFDAWMARTYPGVPWCRYADDGLVHCKTEQEAQAVMAALNSRLAGWGLQMHPDKTQLLSSKDGSRKG